MEHQSREDLIRENIELKKRLECIKNNKSTRLRTKSKWFISKTLEVILSKNLKSSLDSLIYELYTQGKVQQETLSQVVHGTIFRLTRISIFTLLIALLPILVLLTQTYIIHQQTGLLDNQNVLVDKQNELIEQQNDRLTQQTYLQEANRRSTLIFEISNILDKIDEELKNIENKNRDLSPQLIARIISLSQRSLPYRYLSNDTLTYRQYSPERGQLLTAILNSDLSTETNDNIFKNSNFKHSFIKDCNLTGKHINFINLSHSKIENVDFRSSSLRNASFFDCILKDVDFKFCDLNFSDVSLVVLKNVEFRSAMVDRMIIDYDEKNDTINKYFNMFKKNYSIRNSSVPDLAYFTIDTHYEEMTRCESIVNDLIRESAFFKKIQSDHPVQIKIYLNNDENKFEKIISRTEEWSIQLDGSSMHDPMTQTITWLIFKFSDLNLYEYDIVNDSTYVLSYNNTYRTRLDTLLQTEYNSEMIEYNE